MLQEPAASRASLKRLIPSPTTKTNWRCISNPKPCNQTEATNVSVKKTCQPQTWVPEPPSMMDWESLAQLSFEDSKDGPRCPDGHQPSFCSSWLESQRLQGLLPDLAVRSQHQRSDRKLFPYQSHPKSNVWKTLKERKHFVLSFCC